MRKPLFENKMLFSLQTSKISKWLARTPKKFLIQLNINCHLHRCYLVYPILTKILACDSSPLQAKAMIPNEMPDGKKVVSYTQENISKKFWRAVSLIGHCYIWPGLFKYSVEDVKHRQEFI